jgi:hypothetical protein
MSGVLRAAAWMTVAAIAAGVAGCTASARALVRDERRESRRLQFSSAGTRTVDVRALNGSIRVTGDAGADVRVEAVMKVQADDDAALRAGLQQLQLEAAARDGIVTVTVRDEDGHTCDEQERHHAPAWWDRRRYSTATDVTVRVPRDVRVRLCTVNGDIVDVTAVSGDFDVRNVNGKVVLSGMAGSGRASTVNGDIDATFAASPRQESQFKTINGTIAVTFPRSLAADLRLKTFNGGLYTDFETAALPAEPERVERAGRPRDVYRRKGFTQVRVGAGGPVLTFDTLNGDVRVMRAAR